LIVEEQMIRNFSNHAANERTFLAWTRTGLSVIAFGFVIEKFNVMVEAVANTASAAAAQKLLVERLAAPLGRYDGLALILVGIGLIIIAGLRYARTSRLIDQEQFARAGSGRTEMLLTVLLALLASSFCIFVVFT
jgi:putative membrane protein